MLTRDGKIAKDDTEQAETGSKYFCLVFENEQAAIFVSHQAAEVLSSLLMMWPY